VADLTPELVEGDCVGLMAGLPAESVDAVVTDPPYGLEFLGAPWDRLHWQDAGSMSPVGLGRDTPWPTHRATGPFGNANPSCAACGGRLRGRRRCACEQPDWRIRGRAPEPMADARSGAAIQAWHGAWAREALRVLKPGGHMLAFGGARTHHRLMCAIEDAGFEIRGVLCWLQAQGFPKSRGQLRPGWEPVVMARRPLCGTVAANMARHGVGALDTEACRLPRDPGDVAGWAGTGTVGTAAVGGFAGTSGFAIRERTPEEVAEVLARDRWPADVVLSHAPGCVRTGSRLAPSDGHWPAARPANDGGSGLGGHRGQTGLEEVAAGVERVETWACVDGCPAAALDAQGGSRRSGRMRAGTRRRGSENWSGGFSGGETPHDAPGDSGSASRFFLVAPPDPPFRFVPKAPGRERWGRCPACAEILPRTRWAAHRRGHGEDGDGLRFQGHPTVKPLALIQWLVRLVAPAGALILDPFAGSGTTLLAARAEGRRSLGFERDGAYAALTRARLGNDVDPDNGPLVWKRTEQAVLPMFAEAQGNLLVDGEG